MSRTDDAKPDERLLIEQLKQHFERYRSAGDALISQPHQADGLQEYHREVNPLLRQAVSSCDQIRDHSFRSIEQAGKLARDEAARGMRTVSLIALLTVALGVAVAVWLARSILKTVHELTSSVEAIRKGNFDRRANDCGSDELGQLAIGFNRMAQSLAEYRRSSLGELLSAKTTLEATLNALPDAVFVFDSAGRLAAANPPAKAVMASKQVESADVFSKMSFFGEHMDTIQAALSGRPAPARFLDFERTLAVMINGQSRRYLVTVVPIRDFSPNRFGAIVVLDDATEFIRLDELRTDLIGVASHELKSPLTALRMNLMMLGEDSNEMNPRQRHLVLAAIDGCEELGLTIEELLDVTRIESGQLRLNLSSVDVRSIIADAARSLQTRFDDAGVQLTILEETATSQLLADPARLQSVFVNVLENALKYFPFNGTVSVQLTNYTVDERGTPSGLRVTIADQGPGIPESFRVRVFEKFFRVEHHSGQRDRGVRGTGIGLYLCREIMKAHGGSIRCEAGAAEGTRIVLEFSVAAG
ncbi:MAG TPA: ATP-binding protein [Pirellulaceae bacterium]|nr:ATP-binding protein [Pirellulaceae bacterium]